MRRRKTRLYLYASIVVALLGVYAISSLASLDKKEMVVSKAVVRSVKKTEAPKAPAKKAPVKPKAAPDTLPALDPTVRGTLTDSLGRPMENVVVSDGYTCTVTNAKGNYIFIRDKNARFVWYSVPSYCEVPTHSAEDRTALSYKPLSAKRNVYNFTLKRLPKGTERAYRLIVFGDPQVTNAFSPYYTGPDDNPVKKSDVARFTDETMTDVKRTIAEWSPSMPVYAISMGDDVQYYGGYNASLEGQIRKALGS